MSIFNLIMLPDTKSQGPSINDVMLERERGGRGVVPVRMTNNVEGSIKKTSFFFGGGGGGEGGTPK